ncbi:hypothetical protein [Brevundimonas sp.]|uniref:hypothetical protein n=1 Tax=Brevundimonas sp. TaxID=1871086 RepID=UPI002D6DBC4B|nr:hypothetical protein [Brevundimonas sp.]HYC68849.1 hypothetical protein [Brevundimonas sp.]
MDEDRLAFDGDQRTNFDRARAISVAFAKRQEDFLPDQLHRFAEGIWPRITELSQIFPLTEGDRAEIAEATDSWISRLEAASRAFDPERPTGFREDAEAIAAIQHIARHLLDKDERIVFVTGDWSVLSAYWQWYGEVYTTTPWEPVVVRTIKSFAPLLNLSQLLKGDSASENDRVPFTRIQVAANLALHPFNMRVDAEHRLDDPQVGGLWWFRQKLLENIDRNNIFDDPLFGSIDEDMLATEVEDEFRAVRDIFQSLERRASLAALHYLEERRESVLRRTPELANSPDETATVAQFANEAELLLRRSITIWHSLVTQSIRDRIAEASAADNILRTPVNISLRIPLSGGGRELQNLAEVEKSLANLDPAELERPEILAHLIFAIGSISAIRLRRFSLAVQYAELAKDAFRTTFADGPAAARGHPDYQELRYLNAVTLRLQLGSGGSHEFLKAPPPQQTDLMRKRRQAAERDIEGCIAYHLAEGHPLRLARAYMERASIKLFIAVRESARVRGTRSYDRESHHRFFEAVYDLARSFGVISTTAVSEEDQDRRDLRQGLNAHLMATVAAVDCFLVRLPYMQDDRFALEARLHDASAAAAQYLPTADPRSYPVVVRREVVDFLSRRGIEAPAGWRSRKGVSIAIDAEIVHLMNLPVVDLL